MRHRRVGHKITLDWPDRVFCHSPSSPVLTWHHRHPTASRAAGHAVRTSREAHEKAMAQIARVTTIPVKDSIHIHASAVAAVDVPFWARSGSGQRYLVKAGSAKPMAITPATVTTPPLIALITGAARALARRCPGR